MSIVAPLGFLSLPDAVGIVARRQAAEDEQPGRARRRIAAADLRRAILEGKIGLFALFTDRSEPVRLTDRDLLTAGLMPEKTDTVITFAYIDRMSGAPFSLSWKQISELRLDPLCISSAELNEWLQSQYRKKPRGRRAKYNWKTFDEEAIRKLMEEERQGGLADPNWRQADLEKYMAEWCSLTWKREPSESTIRDHVRKAIQEFKRTRKADK
jgi:hypothetical protein